MGRYTAPDSACGQGLYRARLALLVFLENPVWPRWLGLVVAVAMLALFVLSRPLWQLPSTTCRVPHLPDSMEIVYCGSDLIAAKARFARDLLVVYDARDLSRSWPHTFVNTERKSSGQAHTLMAEIAMKGVGPGRRDVLVLGLGGGAIPFLIIEQCSDCHVIGVDNSPDALHIARHYIKADTDPRLQYVEQDADAYVKGVASSAYDAIVVDLSVGLETPEFVFGQTFIGNVHRLLRPGGKSIISMFMSPGTEPLKLQLFSALSKLFRSVSIVELDEYERNFVLQATK